MPLHAPRNEQKFDLIPATIHHAVCYGVVDLGVQPSNNPAFAPKRKLALIFEFPEERGMFEREGKQVSLPRALSKIYTLSLHEKANLRHDLESWRAKPFTEDETEAFDFQRLLGANGQATVIHEIGKDNKPHAKIASISPLGKGMKVLKAENQHLYFSFEDVKDTVTLPANIPPWLKDMIMRSDNYRATVGVDMEAPAEAPTEAEERAHEEVLPDNVPF